MMWKIFLVCVSLIVLTGLVSAFGVTSSYWDGNPLVIAPGETKTASFALQNMVGDNDESIRAVVEEGSEIVSLGEDMFFVAAGTKDVLVPMTISIPADWEPGERKVAVAFETVTSGEGGGVVMGTGMTTKFDVLVVSEPTLAPEEGAPVATWIIVAAVVIVLAIIVWLILRRRKAEQAVSAVK